jgi:hypothetical protein
MMRIHDWPGIEIEAPLIEQCTRHTGGNTNGREIAASVSELSVLVRLSSESTLPHDGIMQSPGAFQ